MSDLNYLSLARLAYEAHSKAMFERHMREIPDVMWRGLSWDSLSEPDKGAWVLVVMAITSAVAAADLA